MFGSQIYSDTGISHFQSHENPPWPPVHLKERSKYVTSRTRAKSFQAPGPLFPFVPRSEGVDPLSSIKQQPGRVPALGWPILIQDLYSNSRSLRLALVHVSVEGVWLIIVAVQEYRNHEFRSFNHLPVSLIR